MLDARIASSGLYSALSVLTGTVTTWTADAMRTKAREAVGAGKGKALWRQARTPTVCADHGIFADDVWLTKTNAHDAIKKANDCELHKREEKYIQTNEQPP